MHFIYGDHLELVRSRRNRTDNAIVSQALDVKYDEEFGNRLFQLLDSLGYRHRDLADGSVSLQFLADDYRLFVAEFLYLFSPVALQRIDAGYDLAVFH